MRVVYLRRLLAAACDKEEKNKPLDEETGRSLRQWRIECESKWMPNSTGATQIVICATMTYQIWFDNQRKYSLQQQSERVFV